MKFEVSIEKAQYQSDNDEQDRTRSVWVVEIDHPAYRLVASATGESAGEAFESAMLELLFDMPAGGDK